MDLNANWFREWFRSPYYHILYQDRDAREAASFIDRLLVRLQPAPGALMLDVACGRGRHACILAEKGFDVTGIDLAPESISYALRFANEHLHFFEHDMRRLFMINYYDFVFNFFTSFGYFKTQREHNDALRSISLSMKSKGVFVLDYLNTSFAGDHLVPSSELAIDGIHFNITRWLDEGHFNKKIIVDDPSTHQQLEFVERVARYSLTDFERMLALQGLIIKEKYGDYQLNAYEPEKSPRLILITERQHG